MLLGGAPLLQQGLKEMQEGQQGMLGALQQKALQQGVLQQRVLPRVVLGGVMEVIEGLVLLVLLLALLMLMVVLVLVLLLRLLGEGGWES